MYHIEEIADEPFMWSEMKFFRRTESLENIEKWIGYMSIPNYERTFRVYHHHDAAIEPLFQIVTKGGEIIRQKQRYADGTFEYVEKLFVGDRRTNAEKDADDAHWKRSHKNRQYGVPANDISQWVKSEHKDDCKNLHVPKKYPLSFRNAVHKLTAQSDFWAKRADRR
jgi:hypothetical protein